MDRHPMPEGDSSAAACGQGSSGTAGNEALREETRFQPTPLDYVMAAASFLICLFGVIAGLWGGFRLGFTLAFIFFFSFLTGYIGFGKGPVSVYGWLCGLLAISLSAVFLMTSSVPVRFLSLIVMGAVSLVWFASLSGRRVPAGDTGLLRHLFLTAGGAFTHISAGMGSLFGKRNGKGGTLGKVLIGILCSVPVLAVVIPLLLHADAAFENLFEALFKDLRLRLIQAVIAGTLTVLLVSFSFFLKKTTARTDSPSETRFGVDTVILCTALGMLSVFYAIYLASQLAYFSSAFSGILPRGYDFSYAEYARRGFFEITVISVINLFVLFLAWGIARKKDRRLPVAVSAFGTFVSVFTLFIISTAFAKMTMYIGAYGMSVLRIGTSAFLVFLAVVFLAVILRLWLPRVKVLQTALVTAAVVLLLLGIGNVNRFVAKYNYEAYCDGRLAGIDAEYLSELGDEGIPYLCALAERKDDPVSDPAGSRVSRLVGGYYTYEDGSGEPVKNYMTLSGFDFPRLAVYKALDPWLAEHAGDSRPSH